MGLTETITISLVSFNIPVYVVCFSFWTLIFWYSKGLTLKIKRLFGLPALHKLYSFLPNENLRQWLVNIHLKLRDLPTDSRGWFTQEMVFPVIEYSDIICSCTATSLCRSDCSWLIRFSVYHNTTILRQKTIIPVLLQPSRRQKASGNCLAFHITARQMGCPSCKPWQTLQHCTVCPTAESSCMWSWGACSLCICAHIHVYIDTCMTSIQCCSDFEKQTFFNMKWKSSSWIMRVVFSQVISGLIFPSI